MACMVPVSWKETGLLKSFDVLTRAVDQLIFLMRAMNILIAH